MIHNGLRNRCASALVCLLALLAAGVVSATPPTRRPLPVYVEAKPVIGADDKVDLHVTVSWQSSCDSVTMCVDTDGQTGLNGTDKFRIGLTENSDGLWVFDTTMTVAIASRDTSSVFVRMNFCGFDTWYPKLLFVTTGDTLETHIGQFPEPWVWPEGALRGRIQERGTRTMDTVKHAYTFDLTKLSHLSKVKRLVGWSRCVPDRPLARRGIYVLHMTNLEYRQLKADGVPGWLLGEEPDSIVAPNRSDGGSSDTRWNTRIIMTSILNAQPMSIRAASCGVTSITTVLPPTSRT